MPSPRRGRSAIVKNTSEGEQTLSEDSADMETEENTGDTVVEVAEEQEVDGNDGTETEEMTVDLEVKDNTPTETISPVAKPAAPKPTVEVRIEGLPDTCDETNVPDTSSPSKQMDSTETDVTEESLATVITDESDVTMDADATEPTDTDAQESVDTNDTAEPSTDEAIKEQSTSDAKPSTTAVVTKPLKDDSSRPPKFPESLTKLRNLTVNIGPIREFDLKSDRLHDVLRMNDKYEIKFELRSKKDAEGKMIKEKSGYVRLPFEITTPKFLIKVAYMLGHLHIDGRDMSVKFPDAFNTAVTDCKKYVEDARLLHLEKMKARKRQISVKNVPANVTEETVRSLFPEAQTITLKMESTAEGSKVGSVRLEFESEEACIQCLDTNKDVFIEDNQLKLFRVYTERRLRISRPQNNRGRGFGRGRGSTQRGGFMPIRGRGGIVGTARGRAVASARGKSTSVPSSPNTSRKGSGTMGPPSTSPRGSRLSSSYQGQFKDFNSTNRQGNRGRPRVGRGSLGYGQQRRDQVSSSPYRSNRSPQQRSTSSYRSDTSYSPRSRQSSSSRGEDPSAIMQYLQTTLARMEQKISSRDYSDRSQGTQSRNGSQFGGSSTSPSRFGGRGNSNKGRGRGNQNQNQNRKRVAVDNRDYSQQAKRQFVSTNDQRRSDSRSTNYYGSQQSSNNSGGNVIGTVVSDYRNDYQSSNVGNRSGAYGSGGAGGGGGGSSGGGLSNDRTRKDSYGNSGRSDNFNTGYSGTQFTSSGGGSGSSGWGQTSDVKGYNQGYSQSSFQGQQW